MERTILIFILFIIPSPIKFLSLYVYMFIIFNPSYRYSSLPPPLSVAESSQKTVSYSGTSPWNSTGFAYTPRYPQSYRGTEI